MVTINNEKDNSIDFEVPHLYDKSSPASVEAICLYKANGTQVMMRIVIKHSLDIPLESLTFKYRFSSLPLDEPDSRHSYHSYVYTDDDLNKKETLIFNGAVPSKMKLEGCTAYISEVRLANGEVLSFTPYDYIKPTVPDNVPPESVTPESGTAGDNTAVAIPDNTAPRKNSLDRAAPAKAKRRVSHGRNSGTKPKKKPLRRGLLAAILTVCFFVIIGEAVIGVYLYNYTDIKSTAKLLASEKRYNEAYKLLYDNEYKSLLQSVCEEASAYYAEEGDYEQAYVYAMAAPQTFEEEIVSLAAANVVSDSDEINENAYRVAKVASDDQTFSTIVHSIIDLLIAKEDYTNALRVASELRYINDRERTADEIFTTAVNHYLDSHRFERLVSFIDELEAVDSFAVSDSEIADAIITRSRETNDSSCLIYYNAKHKSLLDAATIDISSVELSVNPDDPGVRAALDVIWPLLTTEQKRTYHSHTLALYKEQFIIKNGRISDTDITDAVSVDTYEYHTIVLHKDGSVSSIPNEKHNIDETFPKTNDVIQIAAGLSHSVLLHADGTVTAVGDNTYGQCNVSSWTDIVAVAAGQNFTLGLKLDGTLVACGSNACGQCDVGSYRNCVAIAAGSQTSVLLFEDGTVRLQGYRSLGLKDAESVSDAVSIRAGSVAVIVEHANGSYSLFSGLESGSFGSTSGWRDIADYDVGSVCIGALGNNGSIYSGGDNHPDR
ncbi:MAG TPA: hypothetical protein H9681_03770 [Firmicutes bacterium]|nr:hypothetical protein [Bacillota bacterium]